MPNLIRSLRKAAGMSQERLGELVGTSGQQISRLEKGERDLTLEWIEKIASALGVRPAAVIDLEDAPMSNRPRPPAYSEIQRIVGQRMMWARELVEPNRTEVARWMGVDPSTLQKIEAGDRAPSIFNIICYADYFKMTTDFFLRGYLGEGNDRELERRLIALHPELVLRPSGTGMRTEIEPT